VRDLLKAYCQIEERDEGRRIREKLTGKLLTLDDTLRPTLPVFLALLDVPVEDPTWQALEPPQRRQQPLLLVFEDLHWIDTETQALLDSLVESLPTARLLLLVNYRPEYQHGWGSKTYYTQLRLDPLPPASADEFLQALLGDDPSLASLKQLLIARTEGNPFFLEESVRALVETGVLAGAPGSYRLVQPLQGLQAQVYLYRYRDTPYVAVVAVVEQRHGLVMFTIDSVMESAYVVERPEHCLSHPAFECIGSLSEVMA
jgi:hypothetical protein